MYKYPDIFNTVFGPLMQGGSSGHTAGPCRIGYVANSLVNEELSKVEVIIDKDKLIAKSFGLMMEDYGMLAGALGFLPNSPKFFDCFDIAKEKDIKVNFEIGEMKESSHRDGMKFVLQGVSGKEYTLVGNSVGHGLIETVSLNGYKVSFKGDSYLLLIEKELDGNMIEKILNKIDGCLERNTTENEAGQKGYYFMTSDKIERSTIAELLEPDSFSIIKPVMPVVTSFERKPQLFKTVTEWREIAAERDLPLHEIAIQYQVDYSGWSREEVIAYMESLYNKLKRQTNAAYDEPDLKEHPYFSNPFTKPEANNWVNYASKNDVLSGSVMSDIIKGAWSVLSMPQGVELVPGPMGLGGGLMYSSIEVIKKLKGFSKEEVINALFVAGGLGAIVYTHTVPSGGVIGCSGEVGVSSAMSSAAITYLVGGSPEKVESAASLTLQSLIGIPCDPIAGGNMQPCGSRGVMGACLSVVFADMALADRPMVLSFQEVLLATDKYGRAISESMPRSELGCCNSETARKCQANFVNWHREKVAENTL